MSEELLPCPFCGGKATLKHDEAFALWWNVECDCGVSTKGTNAREVKYESDDRQG